MRSNVVGCMDECNMMVVIHTDSRCTMTAPSMTCMSSLSETLWVNVIFRLDCAFSLIRKRQDDILLISCQSTLFGVWTVRMAHMALAYAQMNYHFLQYSQWNQKISFTYRNRYANYFLQRYVVNNHILCRLCTHDLRANTIWLLESISCMVRRYGGYMHGKTLTGSTGFDLLIGD
jgi:hypothetical protein